MTRILAFPLAAMAVTFALAASVVTQVVARFLELAAHLFPAVSMKFFADSTPRSIFETRRAGLA